MKPKIINHTSNSENLNYYLLLTSFFIISASLNKRDYLKVQAVFIKPFLNYPTRYMNNFKKIFDNYSREIVYHSLINT